MEACVGAHHLSRRLKSLGHDARLMPAKYVRPYSKGSGGAKNKLIEVDRDGAKLTTKGKAAAKAAEYNRDAAGATYG